MAGIMLAIHVAVPPHPGVVAGAGILNADIGWTTIIGLLTCIPLGVLGYLVAKRLNRRDYALLSGTAEQFRLFGTGKSDVEQDATRAAASRSRPRPSRTQPGHDHHAHRAADRADPGGNRGRCGTAEGQHCRTTSQPSSATPLLPCSTALGLAYFFLGIRRGWSSQHTGEVLDSALAPIAILILVTAAGGVFGEVLLHLRHRRGAVRDPATIWACR